MFAQNWVTTEVSDSFSIDFPNESEVSYVGDMISYIASDEYANYLVVIRKFNPEQLAQMDSMDLKLFYDSSDDGSLEASRAKIISQKDIIHNNIPGRELITEGTATSGIQGRMYSRSFLVKPYFVALRFIPISEDQAEYNTLKDTYFNSFTYNEVESFEPTTSSSNNNFSNQNNFTAGEAGYAVGKIVGYIISILILVAIIVGFIFLIRFIIRKANNKGTPPIDANLKSSSKNITPNFCKNCNTKNASEARFCKGCGYEIKK